MEFNPMESYLYPINQKFWNFENTSYTDRVTMADAIEDEYMIKDVMTSKPLRENNLKKYGPKHVPHKERPAQAVAKRNARERSRVQAVNSAFGRLRKAVPFQHARGKRISKVKTLKNAIAYIRGLEDLLKNYYCTNYPYNVSSDYFRKNNIDLNFDISTEY